MTLTLRPGQLHRSQLCLLPHTGQGSLASLSVMPDGFIVSFWLKFAIPESQAPELVEAQLHIRIAP